MADTLESLEIEVKHSASGAADEITKVADAISGLSRALNRSLISKLADLASAMKELGGAGSPINLNNYTGNTFNKTVQSVRQAASSTPDGEATPLSDELQETIANAGKLEVALYKASDAAEKMNDAFEKGNEDSAWRQRERALNAVAQAQREIEKATPKQEPVITPLSDELQDAISSANQIDLLRMKLESLQAALQDAFNNGDQGKALALRNQILQTESALAKAEKAARGAADGVRELGKESKKAHKPLSMLAKSMARIAFYRVIRSILKDVGQAFQEGLKNAYAFSQGISTEGNRFAAALDSMSSSGLKMKNQLGSAFIGLLAAIAPIVNAIISLIVRLANALSQLFAAFTGRTYLKANDVSAQFADNMKKGAGAAKEWKNQLLGFDEINRLNEPSGGGGGGGVESDPSSWFTDTPLDAWAQKLHDLIEKIKFDIKDVLFNWDNLNPESIAKKVITGLSAILGAGVGFVIGGVPGAVIGTVLGVAISLLINSLIFDNDGVLSAKEVAKMLSAALFALVGGAVGFMVGGVGGALIGAAVGVGIYATLLGIDFFSGGGNHDVIRKLVPALATYAGFAIGFAVGGPGGAAIGATLGLGISFLLSSFAFSDTSHWSAAEYAAHIIAAIAPFVGAAIGFAVGGPGGALIGAMIGLGIHFLLTSESVVEGETIAERVFGPIVRWCQAAHAWIQDVIDGLFSLGRVKASNWQNNLTQDDYLTGFASGGFPSEGQLFMAREAGPELVGTVGGRTAVANNDQIVEGIRQGVYDAVLAANANNGGGGEFRLYLDSKQIKYGLERVDRAWGV